MDVVVCPHCKSHRIITSNVPKDVVVVMPCPSCHELSVLFRNKVIPLSRRIIERGTFEERKEHFAQVIARFLEAGILPWQTAQPDGDSEAALGDDEAGPGFLEEAMKAHREPITEKEFEKFVRIDLKCIDNAAYFKKHFESN